MTAPAPIPLPLSRLALRLAPAGLLAHATEIAWLRVQGRHPKLMENLARLPASRVILEPTDSPHAFLLELGQMPPEFALISPAEKTALKADAHIKGSLEALVDMLEGRADGDTLFFARDIQITGDTSVIVGLRNTLDREEIDLFADLLSLCGPFRGPARAAISFADRLTQSVINHIEETHDYLHQKRDTKHG